MTPTPSPPAPQGEAKDHNGWICPRCTKLGRAKCVCHLESQVPSAPKAEQVPQEVRALAQQVYVAICRCNMPQAAALIVAERARFAARQLEPCTTAYLAMVSERAQLRRELEEFKTCANANVMLRVDREAQLAAAEKQLAALQRENQNLKERIAMWEDQKTVFTSPAPLTYPLPP